MAHLPGGVWIPDAAARQNQASRDEQIAELQKMVEENTASVLDEWNRILYQIDPELRMVRAQENVSLPGLVPGHYHVVRNNDLGPPTLIALQGEDGEFREPGSWVLDMLQEGDLWNGRSEKLRDRAIQELERQRRRAKENETEERRDEINERWKAASNPGISFANQGSGWRYRAGARRAA